MNNMCIKANSKGLNEFAIVFSCFIVIVGFAHITGHYAWPTIASYGFQNQETAYKSHQSDQLGPSTAANSLSLTGTHRTNISRFHEQPAQPIPHPHPQQLQRSSHSFSSLAPSSPQPFPALPGSDVIRDGNGRLLVITTQRPYNYPIDERQPPRYHQLYDYQLGRFNQQQQQQQQQPPLLQQQHQHESIALTAASRDANRYAGDSFTTTRIPKKVTTYTNNNVRNQVFFQSLLSLQNPQLFGGDILIRTQGRQDGRLYKFERSALVSAVSLWPNGVIYYEIDPSVAHFKRLIWKVMEQFHNETCIRFIPRQNNEPDFLRFEAQRGCFSYIGRIGGEQTLSLGDGCEYTGAITHEILHAVGFYHHQNRSDRDKFLEILWDNIAKGKEGQFAKMADHENLLLNKFDYNSIMLYGPHTFGKTLDRITMKPKTEGVTLLEVIEKKGLSALDIDSVKKLYKCDSYQIDSK